MKVIVLVALTLAAALADDSKILKDFAVGSNQFTANVYKELSKSKSGNFMVAPLSVDVILALIHAGAKGKTAQQISESLQLPNSRAKINEAFIKLSSQLKSTKDYDLISANKIYLEDGFKINDKFNTTAVKVFNVQMQNLEFEKKEESAKLINNWVEKKTRNKIKDLVKPGDLKGAVAVLINAMYFRGKWVKQFSSKNTKGRSFHVKKDKAIQIQMMNILEKFNSYNSQKLNARFLEVPYEGDNITMTFVLPNNVEGLSKLEARIADVLVAPAYSKIPIRVAIPKFKMETSIEFEPLLRALGIRDAFSNNADLSGISNQNNLKVSKIIQKTFIEVEEEGTTAAAATDAIIITKSQPAEFVADHPFIYYIKNKGVVVFVGRYTGQ